MTTMTRTDLTGADAVARWMAEFNRIDGSCPWPGPRPLVRGDDTSLLVGRDVDTVKFVDLVGNHKLVLLTGESGVGKSSLLELGLLPALEERGYRFSVARNWGGDGGSGTVYDLLARAVWDGFDEQFRTDNQLPRDFDIFYRLQGDLGRTVVLVLDQFEELLRYGSALRTDVIKALQEIHHTFSIRIVLSYRSEFHHELRTIEANAQPFECASLDLKEVAPTVGTGVLRTPYLDALAERFSEVPARVDDVIEKPAADLLAERWKEQVTSGASERATGFTITVKTGLLHLQAAVYCLHFRANPGELVDEQVQPITIDAVRGSIREAEGAGLPLFEHLMRQAVETKLELCRTASRQAGLDRFTRRSIPAYVARLAPQLSSASYKLVREVGELTRSVLDEELDAMVRAVAGADRYVDIQDPVVSALNKLVTNALDEGADGSTVSLLARRRDEMGDILGGRWPAWLSDLHPSIDGAGPMRGESAGDILLEELRRMAWALVWMTSCRLLRVSRHQAGSMVVSLIHDGFGEALTAWAESFARDDAISPFAAITAPAGKQYDWDRIDEQVKPGELPALSGTPERPRYFVNAVFRGNSVLRARFRHVVFVNCDFGGTLFEECVFDGVTFLNCRLNGALLMRCRVEGSSSDPAVEPVGTDVPTYVISGGDVASVAQDMASFRSGAPAADALRSEADLPATPVVGADTAAALAWAPASGGLTCYGGRLSSLTLLATSFGEGARHDMVNLTGSGLEVPLIDNAAYGIWDCKLRHVAFSPTPDVDGGARATIVVHGSVAVQWWFSEGLGGSATFHDSMLIQPWVGGDEKSAAFEVSGVEDEAGARMDSSPRLEQIPHVEQLIGEGIKGRLHTQAGLLRGMD